uniref:Cation channel complex component UNC80 N-terminal domain-containing protein n=1 Tax=Meloidogyne enterolobii TaxID=390850 RepID=A0A6V7WAB5_MELEN|nr:unnamed protein product [Meloidogyne enterolobii]
MPLSAGIFGSDSQNETRTNNSEDENETEPIPLPIQSFLWRQTNPFLGSKINKLQDASCVTFERVIVQNILHGLSPSLSEAISSISRWNLVRASFPHIIQCSATLLTERAGEEESLAMSSSLVKILYILHWLLIDANVECLSNELSAPSTNTSNCLNVRQFTYPISSIQLFVYLLAPLFHVVHEEEIEGHIRLESGFRLWTALWQQRLPELICFSAPVKQRRNHLPLLNTSTLLPWTKRNQSTAADQGIYIGEKAPLATSAFAPFVSVRRPSQIPPSSSSSQQINTTAIPPPKPPRTDLNVLQELEMQKKNKNKIVEQEVEEIGNKQQQQLALGTSTSQGIVRSVSDYKSSAADQQSQQELNNLRKSRTTTNVFNSNKNIENSPDSLNDESFSNGIQKIDDLFHYSDDGGFSSFNLSLTGGANAPIVKMNEICSGASIDSESVNGTKFEKQEVEKQKEEEETIEGGGGVSNSRNILVTTTTKSSLRTLTCNLSGDDSTSQSSQQTIVARPLQQQQQTIKQQQNTPIPPPLNYQK